jgi:hypothetical protein
VAHRPAPDRAPRPRVAFRLAVLGLLGAAGCAHHLGPKTIVNDRFDYSARLADSWKEQTLLNIVKLRYLDTPIFLDVGQIVSGYSLETAVSVGGTLSSPTAVQGDFGSLGAAGRYTDRPTITYTPLTGEKFLRGMITPIPPRAVLFLIQSGFAADFVLELTTESLNGLRNGPSSAAELRGADPEFLRVLGLLRQIQAAGAVNAIVEPGAAPEAATAVTFVTAGASDETLRRVAEVKQLLGLGPDVHRYRVRVSPLRGGEDELSLDTRSMLQILFALGLRVEVPEEHVAEGRAIPGAEPVAPEEAPIFRVHSGPGKPADAYAAVRYRDLWFWIDDRDLRTKRTFALIMFVFTLADAGGDEKLPVLTIPTN